MGKSGGYNRSTTSGSGAGFVVGVGMAGHASSMEQDYNPNGIITGQSKRIQIAKVDASNAVKALHKSYRSLIALL